MTGGGGKVMKGRMGSSVVMDISEEEVSTSWKWNSSRIPFVWAVLTHMCLSKQQEQEQCGMEDNYKGLQSQNSPCWQRLQCFEVHFTPLSPVF